MTDFNKPFYTCTRTLLLVLLSTCLIAACGGSKSSATPSGTPTSNSTNAEQTAEAVDGNSQAGSNTDNNAGNTEGETTDGASEGTSSGSTTDNTPDGASAGDNTAPPVDPTPTVRAPADEQILITDSLTLAGSVTIDGMPLDIPVIQWVKRSGPGNAIFADSSSANTSVSFDEVGTYQLELNVSNGPHSASDQMTIVVTAQVINQTPTVNAGDDEILEIDDVLNLSAVISDDGLPNDSLNGTWSRESGPGQVTFGELTSASTTASFSATGNYVLRFTATDGELSANDQISVEVTDSTPTPVSTSNVNANNNWQGVTTSNGSEPQPRHEAGAVAFQGKLYLMGGRGIRQVNRYDPSSNRWENLGAPNFELSHFQPVVHGGKIYVIGSLDCCFPSETVLANIQIFNPANKTWSRGAALPQNRRRGSAGLVVHNNKIYMVGGSTNGHDGGMVNWFDEYNPATNKWKTLPNAPSKRDHFSAAIIGNKLVAAGGRQTDHPATFANLVSKVDVYNFSTGKWTAGANIPTKRAGAMTVSYGDEVILIGGEKDSGINALTTVEAYNVKTNKWRTLDSLNTARHSGGAAIVGGAIHVVSGNFTTGGGNEIKAHEKLKLD